MNTFQTSSSTITNNILPVSCCSSGNNSSQISELNDDMISENLPSQNDFGHDHSAVKFGYNSHLIPPPLDNSSLQYDISNETDKNDEGSSTKVNLRTAVVTKDENAKLTYKCCGIIFDNDDSVEKHQETCHSDKRYTYICDICGECFHDVTVINAHERAHDLTCNVCGKSFGVAWKLARHKPIHTGENRVPCQTCGLALSTERQLKIHMMNIHDTSSRPYKCEVCSKFFATLTYLKQHEVKHNEEKTHKCNQCRKSFKTSTELQQHQMCSHPTQQSGGGDDANLGVICPLCGKDFTKRSSLLRHMRSHTGERPFQCNLCGKAYNESKTLKEHYRIHTGERPYKCDTCNVTFIRKASLRNHQNTLHPHGNENPHKCSECEVYFTSLSFLRKHIKIYHTPGGPPKDLYKCEKCNNYFTLKTSLKRHMRNIHGMIDNN